jgi:hypothetical protein
MSSPAEDDGPVCPRCNHHVLLHCGNGGECIVRVMQPGQNRYDMMPMCRCKYVAEQRAWSWEAYQKVIDCQCKVSDAWKCGKLLSLGGQVIACSCKCHSYVTAPRPEAV